MTNSISPSLYYSDFSRNYLNGTIPKEWGSMMNIRNMYICLLLFFFWFLVINFSIFYMILSLDISGLFYILYKTLRSVFCGLIVIT